MLSELVRRLLIAGRLAVEVGLGILDSVWGTISGYGEKPLRIFGSGSVILVLFTTLYWLFGGDQLRDLRRALYFSAASFVALGYGAWIQKDGLNGWAQFFGVIEALIGVFLIATFAASLRRR